MTQQAQVRPSAAHEQTQQDLRVAELERRIRELEGLDDSVFGSFSRLDWLVCVVAAVVVPALAIWWFRA